MKIEINRKKALDVILTSIGVMIFISSIIYRKPCKKENYLYEENDLELGIRELNQVYQPIINIYNDHKLVLENVINIKQLLRFNIIIRDDLDEINYHNISKFLELYPLFNITFWFYDWKEHLESATIKKFINNNKRVLLMDIKDLEKKIEKLPIKEKYFRLKDCNLKTILSSLAISYIYGGNVQIGSDKKMEIYHDYLTNTIKIYLKNGNINMKRLFLPRYFNITWELFKSIKKLKKMPKDEKEIIIIFEKLLKDKCEIDLKEENENFQIIHSKCGIFQVIN